jgi:site-specific DNA-methyltransferase (adenine-specific)
LEGVYARGRTSTTETESKTTTDWKTLSCCLLQITPESIIRACSLPGGFSANASTAAQIFNASLASLQSTLTLSAIEPATWQALDGSLAEAVKPNVDPVVMARKPLAGTVAANVLEHGTGALNVDGCRVPMNDYDRDEYIPNRCGWKDGAEYSNSKPPRGVVTNMGNGRAARGRILNEDAVTKGRWPANLITDGSDEVVGLFPAARSSCGGGKDQKVPDGCVYSGGWGQHDNSAGQYYDSGSAARFFYTAKATKAERQGVTHPTVKPLDLMAYLCRLVTPPGGIVLDPFMGSGTTIKAALSEGFNAIGIERDPAYFAMAEHRMDGAQLGLGLCA